MEELTKKQNYMLAAMIIAVMSIMGMKYTEFNSEEWRLATIMLVISVISFTVVANKK